MNNYRKFIRFISIGFLGIGLGVSAGCSDVTTEHLLGDPAANPPDPALFGTWYLADEDDTIAILRMRPIDTGVSLLEDGAEVTTVTEATLFLLNTGEENGGSTSVSWMKHHVFTTEQLGASYLNTTFVAAGPEADDSDDGMEGTRIFRYEWINDEQLMLWSMSADNMVDAIETRQIEGEVTRSRFSKDVHLTASSEELLLFLAKSPPEEVFPENSKAGPFQRLIQVTDD